MFLFQILIWDVIAGSNLGLSDFLGTGSNLRLIDVIPGFDIGLTDVLIWD